MAVEGNRQKFCAIFHYNGEQNHCRFKLANWKNKASEIMYKLDGNWHRVAGMYKPGAMEMNRWYEVRIAIRGDEYRTFLDGVEMFFCKNQPLSNGRIGLGTHQSAAHFKDIVVSTPDGKILWSGLPVLPH